MGTNIEMEVTLGDVSRSAQQSKRVELDELLEQWDEDPVQVLLGLPEVNIKATKKQLFKVFAAYRRFKRQLLDGDDLEIIRVSYKPKPGYEDAADPDKIRAPYATSREPGIPPSHERRIQRFIDHMDYKVRHLAEEQREIIKRRYLVTRLHLPKDYEVFNELKKKRLIMSEREYEREKREALLTLAESLGTMVFDIP